MTGSREIALSTESPQNVEMQTGEQRFTIANGQNKKSGNTTLDSFRRNYQVANGFVGNVIYVNGSPVRFEALPHG